MKRLIILLFSLIIIAALTVTAFAEGESITLVDEPEQTATTGISEDYTDERAGSDTMSPGRILLVILIPCAIAGIVVGVMVSSMKTARLKHQANDYVTNEGLRLSVKEDIYRGTTTERIYSPVERNNGSPGPSHGR